MEWLKVDVILGRCCDLSTLDASMSKVIDQHPLLSQNGSRWICFDIRHIYDPALTSIDEMLYFPFKQTFKCRKTRILIKSKTKRICLSDMVVYQRNLPGTPVPGRAGRGAQ